MADVKTETTLGPWFVIDHLRSALEDLADAIRSTPMPREYPALTEALAEADYALICARDGNPKGEGGSGA